ncbi:hypothetical protein A4E84_00790 [Streptomyces qaidamensis]|uniref:Uncharacterized protein n=1 Tax=Streptomyces qaidamensis TaxID=1783515 RepID=A0A143BTJ0_9ACTN|nr:hypothetical protein A4E84_00790 [Streptomyces qaidamensis]
MVGVALGARPVEQFRPWLVLRVTTLPALDQVGVGDQGPAHGHGVGVVGLDLLERLLAGGLPSERAAVDDQLAVEAPPQLLYKVAARLGVQYGEVGQA